MVTVTGIAPGASGVADGGECTSGAADRTRNGSLRVAAVFSDHMVLQRETPVAVFGTAPAGGRVVVDLMDDQGVTVAQTMAVAQAYGEHETETPWLAILPALPASGPYTLRVSHETNRLEFADVMIGEVWLAGGQSNMELELHTSEHGDEAIAAAADPLLRFYNTPRRGVSTNRPRQHPAGSLRSRRKSPACPPSPTISGRGCARSSARMWPSASSTATSAARRSPAG